MANHLVTINNAIAKVEKLKAEVENKGSTSVGV